VDRKSTPIPEPIAQLQRQLDQFRSTQPQRTKLPESLWQAAVELPNPANRAQPAVWVRTDDGELAERVSIGFAEGLLASGSAKADGKYRLRDLRLESGIVISKSSHSWALFEEERRKHGDNAVRCGTMASRPAAVEMAIAKAGLSLTYRSGTHRPPSRA
jgi:hypothetical protein